MIFFIFFIIFFIFLLWFFKDFLDFSWFFWFFLDFLSFFLWFFSKRTRCFGVICPSGLPTQQKAYMHVRCVTRHKKCICLQMAVRNRVQIIANLNFKQLARWPITHRSALSGHPMAPLAQVIHDGIMKCQMTLHRWRNDQPMKSLNCLKPSASPPCLGDNNGQKWEKQHKFIQKLTVSWS